MLSRLQKIVLPQTKNYLKNQTFLLSRTLRANFGTSGQMVKIQDSKEILGDGISAFIDKKYSEAASKFEFVLKLETKSFGKGHLETLQPLSNLGSALHKLGQEKEAYKKMQQAYKILIKHNIQDHRKITILQNMGEISLDLDQAEKSHQYYKEALKYSIEQQGEGSVDSAYILAKIGISLKQLDRNLDAIQLHQKALEIFKANYGINNQQCASNIVNIGENLLDLKQFEEAIKFSQKGLQIYESLLGQNDINCVQPLYNIAYGLRGIGQYAEAMDYVERASHINREFYNEEHHEYIETQILIGILKFENNEVQTAIQTFENILSKQSINSQPHLQERADILLKTIKSCQENEAI